MLTTVNAAVLVLVAAVLLATSRSRAPADTAVGSGKQQQLLCSEPRVWVRPGFLSEDEVVTLLKHALETPTCWEKQPSGTQATCDLETHTAAALANSALMRDVDARVAVELGAPNVSFIERGYLQAYAPGYAAHNLHLDQGSVMVPARVASAILYLDTQPEGAGHTVFPFACRVRGAAGAEHEQQEQRMRVEWNAKLLAGRIVSRFFRPGEFGHELFGAAQRQCEAGDGVRPVRGSAVFFQHRTSEGLETIDAAHASCGLPAAVSGHKRVLVKIACDGVVRDDP